MEAILGQQLPITDAIQAYQLTGQGGVEPISIDSQSSAAQPFWLHLNYSDEKSAEWINGTAIITNPAREGLLGENPRPRLCHCANGILITLRSINFTSEHLPDPLVGLRIYLSDNLIISSRNRLVYAIDEVTQDLLNYSGPTSVGDWLVQIADSLTDQASEFIDELHGRIIDLEDGVLAQEIPERGEMALIRKQLIILRRYLLPQRDVFARLAIEKLSWMTVADHHRMQEVADRLGRGLDDIDASIARTTVLSDEINNLMAEATNRRTYVMSLLAMLFLPASFLTGLFGVNLRGIPGSESSAAFIIFCGIIIFIAVAILWWLKRSKWL